MLAVDPTTESFLVNATLSFRQKTGFTRVALQRAMTFALQNAQIYCGQPPDEVQQWRARMASVLWPHPPRTKAEARRKFVWDHVLNGDVRLQTELQHFCSSPECCPDGIESFRAKLQQPHGIAALLSPAPVNFPRRSWQGQHASGGHILQLLCTHSLLLHMPFDNDVLDYLHRSDAAQNLYLAVRTLARTDELKRAAVGRCGHDYEHKQMCQELPGSSESSVYPCQTALEAKDLHSCLESSTRDVWEAPCHLSDMFQASKSDALQLLLYRMMTRLQGSLYALGIIEQRVYPYCLFNVMKDSSSAADVLEDVSTGKELLDSFGKMMLSAYPTASGRISL